MSLLSVAVGDLVEQHASEAAFLWGQRDAGSRSPGYDLDDLADLDAQLEAHLDGLRIAGDVGWKLAFEALEEEIEPGEAFVAAKLALDRNDLKGFALVLDKVGEEEALWRALPAAIGFCPAEAMGRVLGAMVAPEVPAMLKKMGIAGHAVHRIDPGDPLEAALSDEDRGLRLRALKAVGELSATRLVDQLTPHMTGSDGEARFWASYSAALLGQSAGVMGLQRVAEVDDGPLGERAAQLAGCLLRPGAALNWITGLDAAGRRRVALIAAAASGHPELLPWIADCMKEEDHARRAGSAFYAITGVIIDDELEADAPEESEEEPADDFEDAGEGGDDPDEDLDWPHPDAVASWIEREQPQTRGERLLLGKPIGREWLQTVLRDAPQPQRQLAAWLRFREGIDPMPFPVSAPATEQRAKLPPRPADTEPLS
jgi:uncharacterized protein (TIGR02270 family)